MLAARVRLAQGGVAVHVPDLLARDEGRHRFLRHDTGIGIERTEPLAHGRPQLIGVGGLLAARHDGSADLRGERRIRGRVGPGDERTPTRETDLHHGRVRPGRRPVKAA